MSNALKKIRRSNPNRAIIQQMNIVQGKKEKVFLYKGKESDHAVCQYHIPLVGQGLANKLETKEKKLVKAELKRIERTDLPCEFCERDKKDAANF
jgi:hypothetical protein